MCMCMFVYVQKESDRLVDEQVAAVDRMDMDTPRRKAAAASERRVSPTKTAQLSVGRDGDSSALDRYGSCMVWSVMRLGMGESSRGL